MKAVVVPPFCWSFAWSFWSSAIYVVAVVCRFSPHVVSSSAAFNFAVINILLTTFILMHKLACWILLNISLVAVASFPFRLLSPIYCLVFNSLLFILTVSSLRSHCVLLLLFFAFFFSLSGSVLGSLSFWRGKAKLWDVSGVWGSGFPLLLS